MGTSEPATSSPLQLPRPLSLFLLLSFLLTGCCGAAEIFCKRVLHLDWPYTNTLLPGHFDDLKVICPQFRYYHQLRFFSPAQDVVYPFMYPATVASFYELFCSIPRYAVAAMETFIASSFVVGAALLWRNLLRSGLSVVSSTVFLAASLALSYPFWFEVRQANMEIVVWFFVALGCLAYFRRWLHVAAILFGIAASLKIFPLVYLGLFLSRGKYKYVGTALFAGAAFTLVSQWLLYPDLAVSWALTGQGLARFRATVMLREIRTVTGFDHSLFGFYKRLSPSLPPPLVLGRLLSIYLAASSLFGVVIFWIKIRKLPIINQILSLSIASILFPPTSFDYTLMHLYIPWSLLVLLSVQSRSEIVRSRGLSIAFVCFAILMSPESEFIHNGLRFGGQIKAVTLVLLLALSLIVPFPREGEEAERSGGVLTPLPEILPQML